MITFHPNFSVAEVARAARQIDAHLVQDGRGNIVVTPGADRHTNANVVRMPRHKGQIMHADLPTGPDAA